MTKSKGISLTEYSVIIGLVVLVLIPVLFVLGDKVYKAFQGYSDVWNSNPKNIAKQLNPEVAYNFETSGSMQINSSSESLSTEETATTPVKNCQNSYCEISFGEFTLTGVPEKFNEIVETNGASAGSDVLSTILLQISDILKSENNLKDAAIVKELAVTGHNIASIEKYVEKNINQCNKNADCIHNFMHSTKMTKPKTFDETYYSFKSASTVEEYVNNFEKASSSYLNDPDKYEAKITEEAAITYIFHNKLQEFLASSAASDELKGVVQELCWEIGTISEDFDNIAQIADAAKPGALKTTDFLTGEKIDSKSIEDLYKPFKEYKASRITNVDSALICASGSYTDTGEQCH